MIEAAEEIVAVVVTEADAQEEGNAVNDLADGATEERDPADDLNVENVRQARAAGRKLPSQRVHRPDLPKMMLSGSVWKTK